jgi:hypothetical protein
MAGNSMIFKRAPFLEIVIVGVILFLGGNSFLYGQERDEIPTKFNQVDSIDLQQYYPKPTITAIEILVGPSLTSIKGVRPSVASIVNYTYYATTPMNLTGYSFGIGMIHSFSKHFEIQTRLFWERKGFKEETDSITLSSATYTVVSTGSRSKQSTKSDYFTFSVVPQLLLGNRSHFNLGIGGYFGILEKSRVVIQYINPTPYQVLQQGAFTEHDYGLSINAGYTLGFKQVTQITIQFAGSYGLKQISTFHDLYSFAPPLYNRSFAILLGVRLMNNLKKINLK